MNNSPANVDLNTEALLLGQILLDPQVFHHAAQEGLNTDDFYRAAHRFIWEAASRVVEEGEVPGYSEISTALRSEGHYEEVGGGYFAKLIDGVPRGDATHSKWAVVRLRKLRIAREAQAAALQLAEACGSSRDGLDGEGLAASISRLEDLAREEQTVSLANSTQQVAAIKALRLHEKETSLRLGFPLLDETLDGIRPGEVLGIMARSSVGKSSCLFSIARQFAIDGFGHVMCSLEMPTGQVAERLARLEFGWNRHQMRWNLDHNDFNESAYIDRYRSLHILDAPATDIKRIRQFVRSAQRTEPIKVVSIDYLGLIGGNQRMSGFDRVSQHATDLKDLAKALNVVVVILIQVGRVAGEDGALELSLASARGSGVIEEAVDYLLGFRNIEHSDKLNEQERQTYTDVLWGKVIKNRHGMISRREVALRRNPTSLALKEDAAFVMDPDIRKRVASANKGGVKL